jgi:acyl-coenzyme A synthetase/AMP-(fatty) acid ligase
MGQLNPLSSWLQVLTVQNVAVSSGSVKTTEDLAQRVRDWVNVLAKHSGTRWVVYHNDAYEFLSILLALWQLDRIACIPGDNRSGTMQRLKTQVQGFVGQCDLPGAITDAEPDHSSNIRWKTAHWKTLAQDFVCLEIYTSGSTGDPKAITKTIAQLDLELETLEAQWPSQQLSDQKCSVVLSTVTHQHMYGIIFRLLWPFSAGRPFEREWCEYMEDILRLATCYPSFILISSPSHLSRINTELDWHQITGRCDYVLSSAAPLACADSLNVNHIFKAPVREIYGSSETGAIAWREQMDIDSDALWRALPEVELEPAADDTLIVRAPYLASPAFFSLPDRVEFNRVGDFRLLGRVDRIVKVEGKRVSLLSIEKKLMSHDWVNNAKALTVERRRVETAVVVELTEQGQDQLALISSKGMTKQLKASLADFFDAVVLPRRWRFVDRMPFNPQGKLPLDSLQALFVKAVVEWPEVLKQDMIDGRLVMECRIPKDLIYFDGHFPSNPILPGIVQAHWAESFGRQFLSVNGSFTRLEAIKFQQVIPPECIVALVLSYEEVKNKLSFQYESTRGVHSSGRICFE